LLQLVLAPLLNAASRELEARADRFALATTDDASAGMRAFRRLAEQNLADADPPRWAELLFASHPSLATRIRMLESSTKAGASTQTKPGGAPYRSESGSVCVPRGYAR